MNSIKFKPIGSSTEKGRALERLVGSALIGLGFTDLRYNIHTTGEEIDLQGKHRVTGIPIKVQCKATSTPIGSEPLRLFYGDLNKERGYNPETIGIFVSISGFTGTALRWYDELSDDEKRYFRLIDANELYGILVDSGTICSKDKLEGILLNKTKLQVVRCTILITERGPFWEVELRDNSTGNSYYILTSKTGNDLSRDDIEFLFERLDTENKTYISLDVRKQVILSLLNIKSIKTDDLIEAINESPSDIKAAVSSLISEGIIIDKSGEVSLSVEIDAFLSITRYCKSYSKIIEFMRSDYFLENISMILSSLLEAKYKLKFSNDEINLIEKIVKISPRALERCLLGDATLYRNFADHLAKLKLNDEKSKDLIESQKELFISELIMDLGVDLRLNENKELLSDNEIVAGVIRMSVGLATKLQPYISVQGEVPFMLSKAKREIRAGEILTVTGPDLLLDSASAYMALNEFDKAISLYEKVIEGWRGSGAAIVAQHNKGLALFRQRRYEEAITEFQKVRNESIAQPKVLFNLALCYKLTNNKEELKQVLEELSEKWPDEYQKFIDQDPKIMGKTEEG